MSRATETCQARFARRWGHLAHPRVRALAWLLDAPDLLDAEAAHWQGRIASLPAPSAQLAAWLAALDRDPAPLDAALGERAYSRLGLYAEKLMAFYFREQGQLLAHGLQVRASRNDTIGEFDFLLAQGDAALHLEFATKFYLLDDVAAPFGFDSFVGPNLVDSLGAKMRKILDQQLALASHPAAQALLPRPVASAQALVKGWLFYPRGEVVPMEGIAARHCHGFWCALREVGALEGEAFAVVPRLQWLAPFHATDAALALDRDALQLKLAAHFGAQAMPVLVAILRRDGEAVVETARGFIVPDDWRARALARRN